MIRQAKKNTFVGKLGENKGRYRWMRPTVSDDVADSRLNLESPIHCGPVTNSATPSPWVRALHGLALVGMMFLGYFVLFCFLQHCLLGVSHFEMIQSPTLVQGVSL